MPVPGSRGGAAVGIRRAESFDFVSPRQAGPAGLNQPVANPRSASEGTTLTSALSIGPSDKDGHLKSKSSFEASSGPKASKGSSLSEAVDNPNRSNPTLHGFPFLIADHFFDASSLANPRALRDPATICLSFEAGDVVFVHFAHESGWADATMLRTCIRGWVPANYFSAYVSPRAMALLSSSANFVRNPRSYRLAKRRDAWSFSQGAINEIVAGVRATLAAAHILNREAPVTERSPSVRRARKALLTELAHVVQVAKDNRHTTDNAIIDKLVRGVLRTVNKVVLLLEAVDVAEQVMTGEGSELEFIEHSIITSTATTSSSSLAPLKTAAIRASITSDETSSDNDIETESIEEDVHPLQTQIHNQRSEPRRHHHYKSLSTSSIGLETPHIDRSAYGLSDASSSTSSPRASRSQGSLVSATIAEVAAAARASALASNRGSTGDDDLNVRELASLAIGNHRTTLSTSTSVVSDIDPPDRSPLTPFTIASASPDLNQKKRPVSTRSFAVHAVPPTIPARLDEVQGALQQFLSEFGESDALANMISNDSAAAWERVLTSTRHSMLACRELLTVLDAVAEHADPSCQHQLDLHRDALFTEIRKLVSAARAAVASEVVEGVASPAQTASASRRLVNVAAVCRTLADKCAAAIRASLDTGSKPHPALPTEHEYPSFTSLVPPSDGKSGLVGGSSSVDRCDMVEDEDTASARSARSADSTAATSVTADSSAATSGTPMKAIAAVVETETETESEVSELVFRNGSIRGGTVDALVHWLVTDASATPFYLSTFLLVFRLFSAPAEVAEMLDRSSADSSIDGGRPFARLWLESFWRAGDEVALPILRLMLTTSTDLHLLEQRVRMGISSSAQIKPRPLNTSSSPSGSLSSASASVIGTASASSLVTAVSDKLVVEKRRTSAANVFNANMFGLGASRRISRRVSSEDLRGRSGSGSSGPSWVGSALRFGSLGNGSVVDLSSSSTGSPDFAGLRLIELDAPEIAAQLTLMTVGIFTELRADELLDQRFAANKKALGLAPHIAQLVLASNHLTAFICDTILGSEHLSMKSRTRILKTWLKVARAAYELGNLNLVVVVMLALQSGKIMRLRRVWEALSPKSHAILQRFGGLTAPERNFMEYRRELREREGHPCIPYIGLFLSDLTLIDEGNPKTLPTPPSCEGKVFVNFDRYLRGCRVISHLQSFQSNVPRDLAPNQSVQSWLRSEMAKSHSISVRDDEEQWRRSYVIEPNSGR